MPACCISLAFARIDWQPATTLDAAEDVDARLAFIVAVVEGSIQMRGCAPLGRGASAFAFDASPTETSDASETARDRREAREIVIELRLGAKGRRIAERRGRCDSTA
jgi:hypothetical protein